MCLRVSAFICGGCLSLVLSAQAAPSVQIEDLTWIELRDQVRAGKTIAIVPIGGTEQNGPHMALGKHNARARILAGRIATELGNALVAPVIAYVPEGAIAPPSEHMKYPGTITNDGVAFEKTLESAARSFRAHGFRDVVFLGDHGGYQKHQRAVAARLNREWAATPARAHSIDEYYTAAGIAGHADRADTSLTMALVPEMVHSERIGAAGADGVRGDARGAGVDEGQKIANSVVSRSVEAIRKAVRR